MRARPAATIGHLKEGTFSGPLSARDYASRFRQGFPAAMRVARFNRERSVICEPRQTTVYANLMKWRSLEESAAQADFRPLRETLAQRKESIAKYVPAEATAVHARAIAELRRQQLAQGILPVRAKAPEFELPDHDGRIVASADLLAKRLVLCFIRGRWCPFCVGQMEAMNLLRPELEIAGASLVAISPQTVKQSFFMHDQHQLRFPLLSDAGNQVARKFGLTYRVGEQQKVLYQRTFVNLPLVNGNDSWELPMPASYIIDRDGTVLHAWADEDYTVRPEPSDLLEFLRKLR